MGLRARTLDVDDGTDLVEFCYSRAGPMGFPWSRPAWEGASGGRRHGPTTRRLVCTYPERRREVLVEHLAVNSVMAGCRPEYTPVVVAISRPWRPTPSAACTPATPPPAVLPSASSSMVRSGRHWA